MHFLQDRSWENQNFLKGQKGIPWLNQTVAITMETNAKKNINKRFWNSEILVYRSQRVKKIIFEWDVFIELQTFVN